MPQMSPLLWLFLYLMFSLIFVIVIIQIYFNLSYSPMTTSMKKVKFLINWKW